MIVLKHLRGSVPTFLGRSGPNLAHKSTIRAIFHLNRRILSPWRGEKSQISLSFNFVILRWRRPAFQRQSWMRVHNYKPFRIQRYQNHFPMRQWQNGITNHKRCHSKTWRNDKETEKQKQQVAQLSLTNPRDALNHDKRQNFKTVTWP